MKMTLWISLASYRDFPADLRFKLLINEKEPLMGAGCHGLKPKIDAEISVVPVIEAISVSDSKFVPLLVLSLIIPRVRE